MRYDVILIVAVYNEGGAPDFIVHMRKVSIEQALSSGDISDEDAQKALQQAEDSGRPIKEQFRFKKNVELPFVPHENTIIDIGDVPFRVARCIWKHAECVFECRMNVQLDNNENPFLSKMMKDLEENWEWLSPEVEEVEAES